jgi:hypothetical protein
LTDFPQEHQLPSTADEVIELLERAFPLRNHPVDTPLTHLQREFGARDVIDFLRQLQRERDEKQFGTP